MQLVQSAGFVGSAPMPPMLVYGTAKRWIIHQTSSQTNPSSSIWRCTIVGIFDSRNATQCRHKRSQQLSSQMRACILWTTNCATHTRPRSSPECHIPSSQRRWARLSHWTSSEHCRICDGTWSKRRCSWRATMQPGHTAGWSSAMWTSVCTCGYDIPYECSRYRKAVCTCVQAVPWASGLWQTP